ncbi:RsmB/NOP family class I SAM-dependent RNA methyltransferase [Paeniglutamicibacter cryotolerans]|uniref:16S rRNA (Cytosine967-C5)-methyltransferase n=1 Tax=Paeniglutamicibacter cryotolerans TaxID=670079 RepID=A0A839QRY9_9MICC|nr:transcription antitermination factor NusB [Paeniglutamicibacter cryotolerans]MBB2996736.1 16S rRNA (cytosine967-C5)-methyltransferase [Paeniglutamicibacter cryotolerans]
MSGRSEYRGNKADNGGERRNEAGRERNRGGSGERGFSTTAPSARKRKADPARLTAWEVLRAVTADDAYANLVLPGRIRANHLDKRDAGFATELAYGALRGQGLYDAVLARCVDRPLDQLDPAVLDTLRLGAHQLLSMRVPSHAALDETVSLARMVVGAGASGLINAVLRKVAARELEAWIDLLLEDVADDVSAAALRYSHPEWIVRALRQSLVAHGREVTEINDLLEADNLAPVVNLVALPSLGSLDEAFENGAEPGTLAPDSAYYSGGDVSRLSSVRAGTTRVQDAGSQLVARALAGIQLPDGGRDTVWLDLCAGPGGKASLLAALAAERDATLTANEPTPHRAELVRRALDAVPEETWMVTVEDGRDFGDELNQGRFDRVMVDAPCSGLGALRRRPESRWRKTARDVAELTVLQGELLDAALRAVRPGGVVAYVTCSPHPGETVAVVQDALARNKDARLLDTAAALDAVTITGAAGAANPMEGGGSTIQLWPHVHSTDAMFMALFTRTETPAGT